MPFPDPADAFEGATLPNKPGLGDKDRKILDAMIENGFIRPDRMWFNQPVGNIDPAIQAGVPDNLMEWFILTYSKRPDFLMEENGVLFIAEVKPFASYVALGQALMYRHHGGLKTDPPRAVTPLILTDVADPDLIPVAAATGVEVRELGFFIEPRPSFQT